MSEEMERYWLIKGYDHEMFMEQVNAFVNRGYKVHTFSTEYEQGEVLGLGDRHYTALMELAAKDTYEGIEHLKDVPPPEVDAHLADGWKIASSSISTKFVRMVKTK